MATLLLAVPDTKSLCNVNLWLLHRSPILIISLLYGVSRDSMGNAYIYWDCPIAPYSLDGKKLDHRSKNPSHPTSEAYEIAFKASRTKGRESHRMKNRGNRYEYSTSCSP